MTAPPPQGPHSGPVTICDTLKRLEVKVSMRFGDGDIG